MALAAVVIGCGHVEPQAGRPEALTPILGGRGSAHVPRSKPTEPVEDLWVPVTPFVPAWPRVASELPTLVRALIARGSWIDEHHAVSEEDGVLRVRHRPEVVAQVKRLVEGLRTRLLRPIQIQVAFVEVARSELARVQAAGWDLGRLRASAAGKARVLSQAVLGAQNGQWAQSERVSNQTYLAGYTVSEGGITPRSVILASGYTIQAAAWRWGEDRAVLALTGLYTGEGGTGPSLKQTLHRELPQRKKGEREWREQEATLELPLRELVEFQGQLALPRGRFALAGLLPRDRQRVCAVLARVDWAPPASAASVDPLSNKELVLDVIPVALPTEVRDDAAKSSAIDNRREISQSSEVWFRSRAQSYLENQKKAVFNFQDESGQLDLSMASQAYAPSRRASKRMQSRGGPDAGGNLPEELERRRLAILQAEWPNGTALEFVANHVFVVHRKEVTDQVRRLIERTQEWRNRPLPVEVAFPLIPAAQVDGLQQGALSGERSIALRRGENLLPPATLLGRAGSRSELFVGEMHAALAEAWPPDRSSPPLWVYWRGARLSLRPEPASDGSDRLELGWRQHRLERLGVETVAEALVQHPVDGVWAHERQLELPRGAAILTGLGGSGAKLPALLVSVGR